MKISKLLSSVIALLTVTAASAQSSVSVGYGWLNSDNDLDLGAAYLSYEYEIPTQYRNFSFAPILRYGLGVTDATQHLSVAGETYNISVKVDSTFSTGVKAMWRLDNFSMWLMPVYSTINYDIDLGMNSPEANLLASNLLDDSALGVGVGLRYGRPGKAYIELSYEKYEYVDGLLVGVGYKF